MSVAKVMVILSFITVVHLYNGTTKPELLQSYDGTTEVSFVLALAQVSME